MKSWRGAEEESEGCTPDSGSRWKKVSSWQLLVSGTKYSDKQYGVMVRGVCQAICDEYADKVMPAPLTPDEWRKLADGFYNRWNPPPPHCVAAIDGSLYYNYKSFLVSSCWL